MQDAPISITGNPHHELYDRINACYLLPWESFLHYLLPSHTKGNVASAFLQSVLTHKEQQFSFTLGLSFEKAVSGSIVFAVIDQVSIDLCVHMRWRPKNSQLLNQRGLRYCMCFRLVCLRLAQISCQNIKSRPDRLPRRLDRKVGGGIWRYAGW